MVMPMMMPTVSSHRRLAFFVVANRFCSHNAAILWYLPFPTFLLPSFTTLRSSACSYDDDDTDSKLSSLSDISLYR